MKTPKQTYCSRNLQEKAKIIEEQVLNALRLLESRALKQVEKSTAQKQPRISNFFSPAV